MFWEAPENLGGINDFEETWREDGKVGEEQFAHQFPKPPAIGLVSGQPRWFWGLIGLF